MSRLRLAKIATPANPPANTGELFYSSTLSPALPAWIDENGNVYPVIEPMVKLTADMAAMTTATLTNVTSMAFTITSGVYYRYSFGIVYQGSNVGVQPTFALTFPAVTRQTATCRIIVAADGTGAEFQGTINSSGDKVIGSAIAVISVDYYAMVDGMILPSANGTLQLQAANNAAANNLIIRQGTHGILTPLIP